MQTNEAALVSEIRALEAERADVQNSGGLTLEEQTAEIDRINDLLCDRYTELDAIRE